MRTARFAGLLLGTVLAVPTAAAQVKAEKTEKTPRVEKAAKTVAKAEKTAKTVKTGRDTARTGKETPAAVMETGETKSAPAPAVANPLKRTKAGDWVDYKIAVKFEKRTTMMRLKVTVAERKERSVTLESEFSFQEQTHKRKLEMKIVDLFLHHVRNKLKKLKLPAPSIVAVKVGKETRTVKGVKVLCTRVEATFETTWKSFGRDVPIRIEGTYLLAEQVPVEGIVESEERFKFGGKLRRVEVLKLVDHGRAAKRG